MADNRWQHRRMFSALKGLLLVLFPLHNSLMTKSRIFDLKLQEKTGRFSQIVQGIKNHESRYRLRVPNWRNDLHIGSVYYGEKRGCLHEETKKFPLGKSSGK